MFGPPTDGPKRLRWPWRVLPLVSQFEQTVRPVRATLTVDKQTDRQTDGRTDGRTDRQTGRQTNTRPLLYRFPLDAASARNDSLALL